MGTNYFRIILMSLGVFLWYLAIRFLEYNNMDLIYIKLVLCVPMIFIGLYLSFKKIHTLPENSFLSYLSINPRYLDIFFGVCLILMGLAIFFWD